MVTPIHALLVHGLNNDPSLMNPMAQELAGLGLEVAPVQLTGHWEKENRLQTLKRVNTSTWLEDVRRVYKAIPQDREIVFVGYSVGALLGALLAQSENVKFAKMILFAPAFYIHPWSYLPKLLESFGLTLPSAMPIATRANRGTPVAAYAVLFELIKKFDPKKLRTPTLIVMSRSDELVSLKQIKAKVSQASVFELNQFKGIQHLITESKYTGEDNWREIWSQVKNFIAQPNN